jgi:hypothetical protein
MVEGYAMGRSADELAGELLRVLGDQATANSAGRLRLVGGDASSDGEIQS